MTALTMQPDKTASDKLPPGPPPVPGNIISQLRFYNNYSKDMLGNMMQMYDDYGDMTVMQLGKERIYFLSRPEHHREVLVRQAKSFHKGSDYKDANNGLARFMGNGLVTSDGEFWKRQRKLTQPAFHVKRITAYADVMVDY
ncbi:MAG: cytochrome P450, partial [Aggregatilineales bacterium]